MWRFFRYLKSYQPQDKAIILLYICPKTSTSYNRHLLFHVHSIFFNISSNWKQSRCPSADKWIRNMVHKHNGVLPFHKNEILKFLGKWMELVIIIVSEITQMTQDKYGLFYFICGCQFLSFWYKCFYPEIHRRHIARQVSGRERNIPRKGKQSIFL